MHLAFYGFFDRSYNGDVNIHISKFVSCRQIGAHAPVPVEEIKVLQLDVDYLFQTQLSVYLLGEALAPSILLWRGSDYENPRKSRRHIWFHFLSVYHGGITDDMEMKSFMVFALIRDNSEWSSADET